jgi:YidC/Oxa1 family membrane protein insertase
LLLAMLLVGILLFGWDTALRYFYPNANKPKPEASASPTPVAAKPTREGGLGDAMEQQVEAVDLKAQLARPRVQIAAPGLVGSINLAGGVVDDLSAAPQGHHREEQRAGASVLARRHARAALRAGRLGERARRYRDPDGNTVWTAPAGAKLTPTTPVTLSWSNTTGQTFNLTYAIDTDYMITVTQKVSNTGTAPLKIQSFALINRTSRTASQRSWNLHSGPFDRSTAA